jgi:hypothetical protein
VLGTIIDVSPSATRRTGFTGGDTGYLFRVLVRNPGEDLEQHPGSGMAPGEEMLSKRELRLEFVEEVTLQEEYSFTEKRR